jgi:hypothetical protein
MYFIDFPKDIITSTQEVDIDILKCHEEVVEDRLNSFIEYLNTLDGDLLISSIIVCNRSFIIIDGHHRYHALKTFGVKKVPVTFINYGSAEIKAYSDDRILKYEIIDVVNSGRLLSPKSTKHVIWDKEKNMYMPILLLSSLWYFNLKSLI